MNRSKKRKYTLNIWAGSDEIEMLAPIEISQKEFDRQIKHLRKKKSDIENDRNNRGNEVDEDDEDFGADEVIYENVLDADSERYRTTDYFFSFSDTLIRLTAYECKEGYAFDRHRGAK